MVLLASQSERSGNRPGPFFHLVKRLQTLQQHLLGTGTPSRIQFDPQFLTLTYIRSFWSHYLCFQAEQSSFCCLTRDQSSQLSWIWAWQCSLRWTIWTKSLDCDWFLCRTSLRSQIYVRRSHWRTPCSHHKWDWGRRNAGLTWLSGVSSKVESEKRPQWSLRESCRCTWSQYACPKWPVKCQHMSTGWIAWILEIGIHQASCHQCSFSRTM